MSKGIESQVVKKATKIEKVPTLLQAIERVVEVSKDSGMSEEMMLNICPELGLLAESYNITDRQALLFCVCMEKGPRRVDYDDLASFLDVSNIRILSYAEDIDALVRRRLLRYRDVKDEDSFDVPQPVIKALKHNEVYELPKRTGLDCAAMFELLDQWFEDLDDDAIRPHDLMDEIDAVFKENPQVGFVKQIKELGNIRPEDKLLLLFFCHCLVNKDDDDIRFGQMEDCFDMPAHFIKAKTELRSGEHALMTKKLIEHRCEDGIADTTRYKLTEQAKRTLLAEMKLNQTEEKIADVIKAKDLTKKEMFYVEENRKQVDELHSFLAPEKYAEIRERMQQTGFRTGFACLFYGGPGTGKTETAYQLAREAERDIMVVDVPQIKSKWVGDSEKNIKALFDRYREQVKKCKMTPILLFNEADAIIGIRKQGAQNAVDKMENSIQNIILQEMESLDGIMIATTNLTQNLDSAFERRFLYKIKFEKPDATVRQRLWQSMMPTLSDADAHILATGYDFSGGQIENISRKATINAILHGEESNSLVQLTSFCNSERLDNKDVHKIGFRVP
ncbi:MAG: AAA family ATPase [Bacteroidaceae bacterium]|nr:AAA family ATPase [Bacteroidaceae bacterium]